MTRIAAIILTLLAMATQPTLSFAASPIIPATPQQWRDAVDVQLLDYYEDPQAHVADKPLSADAAAVKWSDEARAIIHIKATAAPLPQAVGRLRARLQQAITLEMARAIRENRIDAAKALRAELDLPRGVSASEGALLLQTLGPDKASDTARILVREAITWQSTRVRQLFDEAIRTTQRDTPMPGRLLERLGEALALADLPAALRSEAGLTGVPPTAPADDDSLIAAIEHESWAKVGVPLEQLRDAVEARLPSLLSTKERERRERLLLKLVQLIPKEYANGVRHGTVVVPLEYREAVTFTQQARQIVGELAPLWLAAGSNITHDTVRALDQHLASADQQIAAKADKTAVIEPLTAAAKLLQNEFGITLGRSGTTADIVDEVMLETRSLLSRSLSAAIEGQWAEAERLRLEAYTTYDPELEARLMPRDPQLAKDIEHLLLDGLNEPGVKVLLDRHAPAQELHAAYGRVSEGLEKATALLKSGISPTAAAMSAASILLREGLEGILVIVAILAGLRGAENARRRWWIWMGIIASIVATGATWILSQTVLTSLRAYGEVIAAVTGIMAIAVLLLITNWLFHQIYWRQWVSTLKNTASEGESIWELVMVGFLIGYREGFEVVLFLQSLILDAGGQSVGIGVAIGTVSLIILGFAALKLGLKLPYFKILLITALLIGLVLVTFVGGTVRAMQTVGWLPVHRLTSGSWPAWMGNWLGLYNTVESIAGQFVTIAVVLGTWRVARWQAKRKGAARRAAHCETHTAEGCAADDGVTDCKRELDECCIITPGEPGQPAVSAPMDIRIVPRTTPAPTKPETQTTH